MKVDKILKVGTKLKVPIVSDSLSLERRAAGRAIVAVQSEHALNGIVELSIGLDQGNSLFFKDCYELYLSGYIESCRQIDKKQQRLVIREFSAILAKRWPMSLRNTNAIDILKKLNELTGLVFNLENADWNKQPIHYFINIGNGFEALDLLGQELDIENFVWQSQPDGSLYIGSLASCKVHKTILALPAEYFKELSASGARCPLVPAFRPGKQLRIGDGEVITIDKITITGDMMRINW